MSCSTTARRGWIAAMKLRRGMTARPAWRFKAVAFSREPDGDAGEIDADRRRESMVRSSMNPRYDRHDDQEVPSRVKQDDARMALPAAREPLVEMLAVRTIPTPAAQHARDQR